MANYNYMGNIRFIKQMKIYFTFYLAIDSHAFTGVVLTLTDLSSVPTFREFALIPTLTDGEFPLN